MPRKGRSSAASMNGNATSSVPPAFNLSAPVSTAPAISTGTTMIDALEHIPPAPLKPPGPFDGELTLPPINEDSKEAIQEEILQDEVTSYREELKHQRRANGARSNSASLTPEPEEEVEEKPKKARKRVKNNTDDEGFTPKKAAKKTVKVTPKKAESAGSASGGESGEDKPKKKTPKKSRVAKDEPEYDSEGNEIVKKKRKVKVYPKITYEIPDVERKESTFKGRLGYACLNTVLRSTKPDSIFCSRTCRIASIEEEGLELPKGLALMNVRDLKTMIEWNEQNKIRFLRLSSEMFPFASHDKYGYDLSFAEEGLKEAGDLAKKYGHRITLHPGQFTQLGSPREAVIKSSVRELEYQCEILDRMGIDQDGVMIIHMGGVFGDKPSTLARFKENYTTRLSDRIKARLVLENDEICYNVDDLYDLCNELNIPLIFDYHHDWINPSSEPPSVLVPKINEMWKRKGIRVKQHLSEPRPGAETVMEKRAHADRCKELPKDLPDDVDLMIEAKDKEQAVFELHRIYGLEETIYDNLRPADPAPGMRTKGRKSSLKKKVKETGEVDSEGESVVLSDVEKEGDGGVGDEAVPENNETALTPKKRGRAKVEVVDGIAEERPKGGRKKKAAAEVKVEERANGEDEEVNEEIESPPKKKGRAKKVAQTA